MRVLLTWASLVRCMGINIVLFNLSNIFNMPRNTDVSIDHAEALSYANSDVPVLTAMAPTDT